MASPPCVCVSDSSVRTLKEKTIHENRELQSYDFIPELINKPQSRLNLIKTVITAFSFKAFQQNNKEFQSNPKK